MTLAVGSRIPSFTLPDQDGKLFDVEKALGQGPLVVFFYPKDETPGCTAEACSFRDATPELQKAGARVVGISRDSVASHKHFADKHGFQYPLLADVDGAVRERFGVGKALFGLADGRVTFVIDDKGIVRHRFESLMRATRHVDEAIAIVRSLAA